MVSRALVGAALLAVAACAGSTAEPGSGSTAPPDADGPTLVQAGAPGDNARPYDASSLDDVEGIEHTPADVAFMQGMIHHHAQALEMTALIADRTDNEAIHQIGLRMEISQADEIALMERWLAQRDEEVPSWRGAAGRTADEHEDHADHGDMGPGTHAAGEGARPMMPGMLTAEQMARLEAARDEAFDRLFLELMIQHHEGALVMVQELFATPGAGQESQVFQLAHEVDADQVIEIRRMYQLLEALP